MIESTTQIQEKDQFKFVMPADLEKGKDGEWKIRGLASTEKTDLQQEVIMQKGIDLTPIDKKKGILNFDHQKGPENTIGLLDGYQRTAKGLVVEGRLFKNHTKAKAVYEIMSSLAEGDRGRVGLSVEGQILERDPLNPKIIKKCRINAVAVTLSPVNTDTFADLVKSMNGSEEVEFNAEEQLIPDLASVMSQAEPTFTATQVMAIVQKALSVGAASMGAPDAKTGGDALQPSDMKSKKKKKDDDKEGVEKGGQGSGVPGHTTSHNDFMRQAHSYAATKNRASLVEHFSSKMPRDHAEKEADRMMNRKPVKYMSKSMYKSSLITILDKLQVLYPQCSRSEIWEAVKERLETKFDVAKGIRIKNTSGKEREHKLYEEARQRGDYESNKDKSRSELAELAEQSGASKHDKQKIRAQADAAKQVGDRDHVRPNVKG